MGRRKGDRKLVPPRPKLRLLRVEVVKETSRFGFRLRSFPQIHGHFVSWVWNSSTCKNLQRFDLLVEINGKNIEKESRASVVSILKAIKPADVTSLLIERGK